MFKGVGRLTMEEMLAIYLSEFNVSDTRDWMLVGDRYYKTENDILNKDVSTKAVYASNNKLAHGYMKKLVDEKVNYLLAKDYSLNNENKSDGEKLKEILGNKFKYELFKLGYESSNKGIGYLQAYITKDGKIAFIVIPGEQCCPIWKDSRHEELEAVLRYYEVEEYNGTQKEIVTKVQHWTDTEVKYYIFKNNKLIIDSEMYFDNPGEYGHFLVDGKQASFGKVPFIPFKNNNLEYGDIRFVKSLVDSYDNTRSENANYIEDVRDLIYVLKGYGGESLDEFMGALKKYRAVAVDGDDGGVDTLNPKIDITASKEHFEQLDKDIIKFGQGVLIGQDTLGNSPSGIALKFLYAALDLKCNAMEREFQKSFIDLQYFINAYLKITGQATITESTLVFNRDIAINESDTIQQCNNSKDIISDETIVENHPWVKDPKAELEKLKAQRTEKVEEQQKAFGSYDFKTAGGEVNE